MKAPVSLFVYNRLDHTKKTVEALQKNDLAQESELFIFSDGPKDNIDEIKVKELRNYLKTITGFKQISIIEKDINLGLAKSIISGVTEIINKYGKIIVLEDDLVTSPYFLKYMNEALNLYEKEDRVISIHGYIYPLKENLPETFFLKNPSCWGWATWKRGWDLFESDGQKLLNKLETKNLIKEFDFGGSYNFSGMLKRQIAGQNNSWAIRWYASSLLKDKLTLYPNKSLIDNTGFDGSGEHSKKTEAYQSSISNHPILVKKIEIKENSQARKAFIKYFKSVRFGNKKIALMKKIIKKIIPLQTRIYLITYLNKIIVSIKKVIGKIKGISIIIPNPKLPNYYIFKEMFDENSTIIDVGCGFDADFSVYMIKKYGLKSIGVDPTLKHQPSLTSLSEKLQGRFLHKLWAISATNGTITFNESEESVSGSILNDHKNLQNEKVKTYDVESISLSALPNRLNLSKIEFIKLDIEGAEYDLIDNLKKEDLIKYNQIFIEFHHHAIPKYSKKDTIKRANKIKSFGFKSFSLNNHDFLFYR